MFIFNFVFWVVRVVLKTILFLLVLVLVSLIGLLAYYVVTRDHISRPQFTDGSHAEITVPDGWCHPEGNFVGFLSSHITRIASLSPIYGADKLDCGPIYPWGYKNVKESVIFFAEDIATASVMNSRCNGGQQLDISAYNSTAMLCHMVNKYGQNVYNFVIPLSSNKLIIVGANEFTYNNNFNDIITIVNSVTLAE